MNQGIGTQLSAVLSKHSLKRIWLYISCDFWWMVLVGLVPALIWLGSWWWLPSWQNGSGCLFSQLCSRAWLAKIDVVTLRRPIRHLHLTHYRLPQLSLIMINYCKYQLCIVQKCPWYATYIATPIRSSFCNWCTLLIWDKQVHTWLGEWVDTAMHYSSWGLGWYGGGGGEVLQL